MAAIPRAAAWVLAALLSGCAAHRPDTPAEQARPITLTILHINDHHSHLAAAPSTFMLQTSEGRSRVSVSAGGFARVKTAFDRLSAASPDATKLHAGDALTGTLYFNRVGRIGEADAIMMNAVCFDAFALGNHEFDKGDSGLKGFLDLLRAGSCRTPVLSANVRFGAGSALDSVRAPGWVRPSVVLEREGQLVGIVGLTIAAKTKASSSPDADTYFEDETTAAQREIDALKARGVDKIIVLGHTGYAYDQAMARRLSGVDVIIDGDSHTLLGPGSMRTTYGLGGTPAGPYPTVLRDRDGKLVCQAQAWEYARAVGELKVGFDRHGDVTSCRGTPHVLIGEDFRIGNAPAAAADRRAILDDVAQSGFLDVVDEDPGALAALEPYRRQVEVFDKTVVARAPLELCSRRVPGGAPALPVRWNDYGRSSAACNAIGNVSRRGGDIQQLVAQAYLEVARAEYGGADLSLQSAGGVREPLAGEVTAGDALTVLPFGNVLFRLDVTAGEIRDMLEDGIEATFGSDGTTGPYPYTGGLRWTVDAAQPRGRRVNGIEIHDAASGTWNALDMNDAARTYKLVVLSFNANGGDGYATLARVPPARRLDVGVLDADVWLDYIGRQPKGPDGLPELRKLEPGLYSTQSFRGPAPP